MRVLIAPRQVLVDRRREVVIVSVTFVRSRAGQREESRFDEREQRGVVSGCV